jgi:hypothetical protein
METGISRDDLKRMKELATKGNLNDERTVDPGAFARRGRVVHMTDVVEMQQLLARAADELERLYGGSKSQQ